MSLNITKHRGFFIKILKDIYTDKTLGPILGFKGGTAAYFFYDLYRFSVDLDFDLLDVKKEDYVIERIEKIISEYGKIKSKRKKYYTLYLEVSYGEQDRNIKIEINRRSFGSSYVVLRFLGVSMKVMTKEDMFANKMIAMYERIHRANRDIFDVWFFLKKMWPINKELVEKRLKMPFKEVLRKSIKKLEELPERSMLEGMGELLTEKQKTWAKKELKKDTIFYLKVMLDDEKNKGKSKKTLDKLITK